MNLCAVCSVTRLIIVPPKNSKSSGGGFMIDQKLLQSVGNLAARDVETRYPDLNIRFLALKNDSQMKVAITPKSDKSGKTVRLFELQPLGDMDPTAIKQISENLESQIIQAVQHFNDMWNRA
jgi:hypothetical protein